MVNITNVCRRSGDRAVLGHWEGDLIIGAGNLSAIGTLVERSSNYTMLVALPDGYKPEQVAPALTAEDPDPPRAAARKRSPGTRGLRCATGTIAIDADIEMYFCDPHSPWQRGIKRTPTGSSASTSRKAPPSTDSVRLTSTRSPPNSTTDPANG